MKKAPVKFAIGLLLIIIAISFTSVHSEGLLPSLSDTVGIAMPSLGEALQRYPDSEIENDDGSITEIYTGVSETDFSNFSVYLEQQRAELVDYHVEGSVLIAEIRAKDASFSLNYDNKTGEAKVTYPAGTFSEWMKNAKTHYDAGLKLLDEGKADEAYKEFLRIPQYSEYALVADLLQNNDNLVAAAEREAMLALYRMPGNIVSFGHYEQDNNVENGPEVIEWIVLDYDEKEHKALLVSLYGLDAIAYNTEYENVTWEECTLRNWLNSEFMQSAFSAEEQDAILMTTVDNSASQGYSRWKTDGGNNTQDQIFLLSYAEANRYFDVVSGLGDNILARVAPTKFAIANRASTKGEYRTADDKVAGWWWLRSPGSHQNQAAEVNVGGSLGQEAVHFFLSVIRPAFWLDLESVCFESAQG